ncbi:hypothetical protein NMG60_11016451 [Bertholletia excelsa]
MALTSPRAPLLVLALLLISVSLIQAQIDHTSLQLMTEALEWPTTMSVNDEFGLEGGEVDDLESGTGIDRRSLYWMRHFYISYGALAANRIPCPARSGRSYYTHNCYKASGPVHPYTRGCSRITHCRR